MLEVGEFSKPRLLIIISNDNNEMPFAVSKFVPDDKSFRLISFRLNEAGGKRFEEEERRAGRSSVVAGSIFSHQGRFHYDL